MPRSPQDTTNEPCTAWRPILEGPVAGRVLEVVRAIAEQIITFRPVRFRDGQVSEEAFEASLAGGQAGLAILYAYLARAESWEGGAIDLHPTSARAEARGSSPVEARGSPSWEETASRFLDRAVEAVAQVSMEPSLYAGFTGVAWALAHLGLDGEESNGEDPNQAIDEALKDYLEQSPWQRDYDLVRGLVGLGVYALDRLPRAAAFECLERIVDRLEETAEHTAEGITWLTRPELLPSHQRQACPQGYYNLGAAHGVPGVIALLGRVCEVDVARTKARSLLDGAVRWLLAQRLPDHAGAGFPAWVGPGIEASPTRTAWCYGNPGIAATLLYAARCVGESAWENEALEIVRAATNRSPEETGVVDAGLCHGAVSLGHVYNRMFQATGEAFLENAARFWFHRALDLRRPDGGIAGYSTWMPDQAGRETWVNDPGILSGAAGVALALLAATTPIEPAWDRMLLISIPPSSAT